MRTQSAPYRATETIDTTDILHISGVLYAGELIDLHGCCSLADPWRSRVRYCEDGDGRAMLTSIDILVDWCHSGSLRPRSHPTPRGVL